jgi:hypothetical protein
MPFNPVPGKKIVILFWNIDATPLVDAVDKIIKDHGVDILLLAESLFQDKPDDLLARLNSVPGEPTFSLPPSEGRPRVQVFTRLSGAEWTEATVRSRYTIWNVTMARTRRFILAAAHFPSVQQDQNDGQRESSLALRQDLERAEMGWDDPLSIVIGDLNANPFDAGIAGSYGLNATQSRRIAQGEPRELNGLTYRWLYNPMWRFLGTDVPGTFYKRLSAPVCFDWFVLDQVLVRPGMIRLFDNERTPDVSIITQAGNLMLVHSETKILDDRRFVRHLPVLFRFYLPEE